MIQKSILYNVFFSSFSTAWLLQWITYVEGALILLQAYTGLTQSSPPSPDQITSAGSGLSSFDVSIGTSLFEPERRGSGLRVEWPSAKPLPTRANLPWERAILCKSSIIILMESYSSVDEYLNNFSGETRKKLDEIRKTIKELVPNAGEKISYGIPTMTLNGKYFIYFAGYAKHVSLYPIPASDEKFQKELQPYVAGKGTVRFPLDKPLPLPLIHEMVKFAVKQRLEKTSY